LPAGNRIDLSRRNGAIAWLAEHCYICTIQIFFVVISAMVSLLQSIIRVPLLCSSVLDT